MCRQQVRNPPMLGMFWGGLVFPRPRIQRVLTLSPKSGLAMRFSLLEARSWKEAKSNLVTVALGKDDRIAWCWTLGPPAGSSLELFNVAKPCALTQRDELVDELV
ncbi:hypothetical protein YC2023_117485 [Brassica napus]